MREGKTRVAVALSGGVDSAVAGLICKREGYEVLGITLYLFEGQEESVEKAKRIAEALEIEHYILDVRAEFEKEIVQHFMESYLKGLTPNPCALCNRIIKFDRLLRFVREEIGVDFLATGHYVGKEALRGYMTLKAPENKKKDQSYFLALIRREHLPYLLFPLSRIPSKEEVRYLALSGGLQISQKEESQDVCFLKGQNLRDFLRNHLGEREGEILYQGKVVGRHRGYYFYTIGQRKGLGIPLGKTLYIVDIDPKENRIFLGEREKLERDYLYLEGEPNLFVPVEKWIRPSAQIRYRTTKVEVEDIFLEGDLIKVKFREKVRGVTPGQVCAFYEGDYLLGGGVIAPYPSQEFC